MALIKVVKTLQPTSSPLLGLGFCTLKMSNTNLALLKNWLKIHARLNLVTDFYIVLMWLCTVVSLILPFSFMQLLSVNRNKPNEIMLEVTHECIIPWYCTTVDKFWDAYALHVYMFNFDDSFIYRCQMSWL